MDLTGKKIVILGGTLISCEIVKAAHALGMEVHVVDYYPPELSPAKVLADYHAQISVADTDAVVSYIKANNIDGVLTGYSDTLLPMYADICEKAGLPCYGSKELFATFTDKRLWKALCFEYGVPTAHVYGDDILDLPEDQVFFPVFVKPSDGSGSRGVAVARSKDELASAIAEARDVAKNGEVLVEQYLEGPELTVFWLFIDGRYEVFMLGNRLVKDNQENTVPLPVGYTFPAAVLPTYMRDVAPKVRNLLESQNVKNGMMFMQCINCDGVPYVYDIGYRLTGSLEQYISKTVSGYSVMDMLIAFAVSGEMTGDVDIFKKIEKGLCRPGYNVSFLIKPGQIQQFVGLDALDANPTVIQYVKAHVEGEILPPEAKGELRQIALRVLGAVRKLEDLAPEMIHVQESVKILDPSGENLLLPGVEQSDFEGNLFEGDVLR